MLWQPVYVGLGSNVGDSQAHLRAACVALADLSLTKSVSISRLYITRPFGPVAQDDFCNAVAGLLTCQPVVQFFTTLRSLEVQLGRAPQQQRWGPRKIDLDLLLFGDTVIESEYLNLPHPGLFERDFVLYPLADIAPQLQVPGLGLVVDLAARVLNRGIRQVEWH